MCIADEACGLTPLANGTSRVPASHTQVVSAVCAVLCCPALVHVLHHRSAASLGLWAGTSAMSSIPAIWSVAAARSRCSCWNKSTYHGLLWSMSSGRSTMAAGVHADNTAGGAVGCTRTCLPIWCTVVASTAMLAHHASIDSHLHGSCMVLAVPVLYMHHLSAAASGCILPAVGPSQCCDNYAVQCCCSGACTPWSQAYC